MDISVIIPTYNKRLFLELTLAALANQSYPKKRYEVIVVCDGCTDGSEEIVEAFTSKMRVRLALYQKNRGRSAARNLGLEYADGDLIIFCDDDCIAPPTFVERHHAAHIAEDLVVCGFRRHVFSFYLPGFDKEITQLLLETIDGLPWLEELSKQIEDIRTTTPLLTSRDVIHAFKRVEALSIDKKMKVERIYDEVDGAVESIEVPWELFVTSNASLHSRWLEKVGGFDESFHRWGHEDLELGFRLYKAGLRFIVSPCITVYHQVHSLADKNISKDDLHNFLLLARKHPCIEILLHWRFSHGDIDLRTYQRLIKEYYTLKKQGDSIICTDYYKLLESFVSNLSIRQKFVSLIEQLGKKGEEG